MMDPMFLLPILVSVLTDPLNTTRVEEGKIENWQYIQDLCTKIRERSNQEVDEGNNNKHHKKDARPNNKDFEEIH